MNVSGRNGLPVFDANPIAVVGRTVLVAGELVDKRRRQCNRSPTFLRLRLTHPQDPLDQVDVEPAERTVGIILQQARVDAATQVIIDHGIEEYRRAGRLN